MSKELEYIDELTKAVIRANDRIIQLIDHVIALDERVKVLEALSNNNASKSAEGTDASDNL